MEKVQDEYNRALPFEFSKTLSIKEITKKFKVMANSSEAFNGYMNKFYKPPLFTDSVVYFDDKSKMLPKQPATERLEDRFKERITDKATDRTIISTRLSQAISPCPDNQSYMDNKYRMMCDTINNNRVLRNSKIKKNFLSQATIPGLVIPPLPILLPQITYDGKSTLRENRDENYENYYSPSPIKEIKPQYSVIDNILDTFYENRSRGNRYIKSEVIYEPSKMREENFILQDKIIEKVKSLSNGEIIGKFVPKYRKIFNENLKSEMHLSIRPMVIEIQDIKNPEENLKFHVPYDLIPLICLCEMNNLVELLAHILRFNSEYKLLSIHELNLKNCMKKISLFSSLNDELSSREEKEFSKIIENIQNSKKKEIIKFTWITNKSIYDVSINYPVIELYINSKNIQIEKVIDKPFLMFLIFRKFEKWDFLTLNYLILIKSFRNLFNKIFTKNTKSLLIIKSPNYNFSHCDSRKILSLDDKNKILYKTQSFENKSYVFIHTNRALKNYFIKINPYYAECRRINLGRSIISDTEKFDFTFKQSTVLFKLSFLWKVENILKKVFFIGKDERIYMDPKILEKFDDDFILYSQKYNLNKSSSGFEIGKLSIKLE
jgi:hypothetical protein